MNFNQDIVWLETLRKDKDNTQNFLFADPVRIITCQNPAELNKCFRQMERCRRQGYYLAGFFAYELGYFLEEVLKACCPRQQYPLLWFGVFEKPLRRRAHLDHNKDAPFYLSAPQMAVNYPQYEKAIHRIEKHIARGETYQINYTSRYDFNFIGNVLNFYDRLKENQKVSYSALINYGDNWIISLSPELFFRINARGGIMVKPMKGTAPPDQSANWLQNDKKNTSENVMIVDLLRNDLGRICLPGSVKVKELFTVEKYETLLQMTSTVTGKLQPQIKIIDLVKSLFPCGSVTGAPKIESMKIISKLEGKPRNIYTGAIGYFAPEGQAVFNVAIRTINLQRQSEHQYQAQMGIGSGIVNDSRPEEEYAECRLKGQFLINTIEEFALIETMLVTDGEIIYLNRHLQRLKKSANYFSIPCFPDKMKIELKKYAIDWTGNIRLRLLLNSSGAIIIQHQSFVPSSGVLQHVTLSRFKTNPDDPFLYHKTNKRSLYDQELKRYGEQGYFDVLFRNQKDEITEGAISNIFIKFCGRWYTPPLSCGLLNGIGRQIMIKKLNAREKILQIKDLKRADQIVLTNSVRGATEVIYQSPQFE
jgi:para-aminobenzoate synthetase/4-amino-4-deoxychorismate lyase